MDETNAADLKTLKLARPEVTREALAGLIAYQRAQLDTHQRGLLVDHARALAAAGIERGRLEVLQALVRDFCGRRWIVRRLEARRAELLARKAQGPLTPKDAEKLASAEKERARVNDLAPLEERYGKAAIDLLREREDELLALHEQLRGCA